MAAKLPSNLCGGGSLDSTGAAANRGKRRVFTAIRVLPIDLAPVSLSEPGVARSLRRPSSSRKNTSLHRVRLLVPRVRNAGVLTIAPEAVDLGLVGTTRSASVHSPARVVGVLGNYARLHKADAVF